MNLISVTDEKGELCPSLRHKLDLLAFYPEEDLSWHHAWRMLDLEYEAWKQNGSERYVLSKLASTVLNSASKRSQQVWVAGLVALAYFGLHAEGQTASINKAVDLVAAQTENSLKTDFVFFDSRKNEFIHKDVRLQSDPASIRQIFHKYRVAAHVCAARIVCVEYMEPLMPFDPAPQADRSYLATVIAFQHVFHSQIEVPWDLRLVGHPSGFSFADEALMPTIGMMRELLGDFARGT